jgi:hypothetical protein
MPLNISNKLSTETVFFQPLIEEISTGRIKVPKFQRPYVWKKPQAIRLLDSIVRSYPIGSLLIWRTSTKLKTERAFGSFQLPETPDMMPTDYVLDGQQRLTVIYSCLAPTAAGGFDVVFDLEDQAFKAAADVQAGLTMFPMRKLFVTTELLNFRTALQAHADAKQLQLHLDELIAAFTQYKLPVVILKDLGLDEVCPIFERINSSGTKLSTYDLMVAATWSKDFDLDDSVNEIAEALKPKGFDDIDRITVVKCMSALQHGSIKEDAIYALRNLDAKSLALLTDSTAESLYRAVDALSTEFGIYDWSLLSYEALVIAMCVVFSDAHTLTAEQHRRLRQWFWRASFSERYKAGGETFVSTDLGKVRAFVRDGHGDAGEFGEAPSEAEWKRSEFRLNASRSRAMALALGKAAPRCLVNGASVDVEQALSTFNRKQFHHLYPRNFLKKAGEENDNTLLNICLLPAAANNKISDKNPNEYLPQIAKDLGLAADAVFASNLLPTPSTFDYSTASYGEFLAARSVVLGQHVSRLCHGDPA